MNLLNYLIILILIFIFYFFVYFLISNKLKKKRLKREKELEKEFGTENAGNNQPDTETAEFFEEIDRILEKREIRGFYISILCIFTMMILIVMSMLNNFKIDYNQYIHFFYYIIPIILLKTMQDGYEYYKKKYLNKKNSQDTLTEKRSD